LKVDRVVVDWRISEYELVDDNEAGHVDKLYTLYQKVKVKVKVVYSC